MALKDLGWGWSRKVAATTLSRLWDSGAKCLHVNWRGQAVGLKPGTGIHSSTHSTNTY